MHRSLLGKALGLRPGQNVYISLKEGYVDVRGCNDHAKDIIAAAVGYDSLGRLRIDPESDLHRTGAQFRVLQ